MSNARVLVVDDEQSMREFLSILLGKEGYSVASAAGGNEAGDLLEKHPFDLVISDMSMPQGDGMSLLERAQKLAPELPVILITAYGSTEIAVEAMKRGAYDYILKPFKVDEMKIVVRHALERRNLKKENIQLKKELKQRYGFASLVGASERMQRVYDLVDRIKDTSTNVLILGESGTGKELVARAIHYNSERRDRPFVTVNCGAIPETLIESELFGHVRGAFTGASSMREGLFETANGGTLFLDEIAEVSPPVQVKLLRAIQERAIRRVGGNEDRSVDIRLIAATNRNLQEEIAAGRFREDLYYRLNVIQIELPSLSDRSADIPMLAEHFVQKYNTQLGKKIRRISAEAMEALKAYHYPGNVRELENVMERAVALETTEAILPESLPSNVLSAMVRDTAPLPALEGWTLPDDGIDLEAAIGAFERQILRQALERTRGIKKEAAKLLKITFRSIRYRLSKYGMAGDDDDDDDVAAA